MAKPDKTNLSADFLIAEFNAIQERAMGLEEIKSGRINFFLIIVAAIIAGISGLADTAIAQQHYPEIILVGAALVLALGVSTLKSIVNYSYAIVMLFRKAGRVRRWFLENDMKIKNYLPFESNDDRPRIRISLISWRGAEAVLLIINAVAASIVVGMGLSSLSQTWAAIGAGGALLLVWLIQVWFVKGHLKKIEQQESENTLFPSVLNDV